MIDKFKFYATGISTPIVGAFSISPDDSLDLAQVTRALYIGVTGDLSVVMKSGEAVTLVNVQAGTMLPFRLQRINQTGTSAQDLVGLV